MKLSFSTLAVSLLLGGTVIRTVPALAQDAAPTTTPAASGITTATTIDPAKEKSIRELMDLMGLTKLYQQAIPQMFAAYRKTTPNISEEVWKRLEAKCDDPKSFDELENEIVVIYARHYTQEDLDGLVAFYKSPLGQKLIAELPAVQRESTEAGLNWGRRKGAEIDAELRDLGISELKSSTAKPAVKTFNQRPFKGSGKVVTTKSGLKYEDMTIGKGAIASAGKTATIYYTGTLTNGKVFGSSREDNGPYTFVLGKEQVMKGWDEGVAGMKVGGRRKLVIPSSLAFGNRGSGPIPPKATLIFDIELIGVR